MKYRVLGKTGVQVSNLCFGTMSFGGIADKDTSRALYARAREMGINFFDCADVYSSGIAEEYLGDFMKGHRSELVITTKVYGQMGRDINAMGASRRHIQLGVEESLRRLGTDWIDVYFIHRFDEATPIEETLKTLDDLVRQGKILYAGVSNWAAWQIEKALGISARRGLESIACIQPMYNLAKRQAEVEILPMAADENLGVITYSPLGGGILTGKYDKKDKPQEGRLAENPNYAKRYGGDYYFELAEAFAGYAREHDVEPAALAVAWVMSHPSVTAPIIGARNVEQLNMSLRSVDIDMTHKWRDEISALSAAPPPATDRSEEA